VRILRQREVPEPTKSNVNFILGLLGPDSRQVRLSYVFGPDSVVGAHFAGKLDLAAIFATPTALLLLAHFTNSIASTE
jgi:hypothetical protein